MKVYPSIIALTALFSASVVQAQSPQTAAPAVQVAPLPPQKADVAAPKMDPKTGEAQSGFMAAHARFVEIAKQNTARVLFLGDSITAGWGAKKQIWDEAFGKYSPANFGIGGDRTQHVLWRITNGEFDGFTPKTVVLMIGTNNSGTDSAEDIAAGVTKIVETIRQKSPGTKVLLLAVFPRGEMVAPNPVREKLAAVNATIAKLDDGKSVHYLDIGTKFLEANGTLTREVMPDLLHLSEKGYQIWADAISPTLAKLME
jgi:lysophospholipase L1-like esterase